MERVVITGGKGSLGRALAAAFASETRLVMAPGRQELDVSSPAAVRGYFADRPVDLLICAAGIVRDAPLARLPEKSWDDTWSVNFRGAADCATAVLPGMVQRGCGHIVFISSHSALHPPAGQAAYAAAKAALLGLMESLASRHGPFGIRANAILPGFLETGMTREMPDRRKGAVLAAHALRRFNTSGAVADFVRHLHERMPHTSGQTFRLDSRIG